MEPAYLNALMAGVGSVAYVMLGVTDSMTDKKEPEQFDLKRLTRPALVMIAMALVAGAAASNPVEALAFGLGGNYFAGKVAGIASNVTAKE